MKISLDRFKTNLIRQKKESANLETGHLKSLSLRNKNKKRMKSEPSLRDLWDNMKCTNISIMVVEDGGGRKGGKGREGGEKLFEEIMDEHFPKLKIEMNIHCYLQIWCYTV